MIFDRKNQSLTYLRMILSTAIPLKASMGRRFKVTTPSITVQGRQCPGVIEKRKGTHSACGWLNF